MNHEERTSQLTREPSIQHPPTLDCSLSTPRCSTTLRVFELREERAMFDEGEERFKLTRNGLRGYLNRLRALSGTLESTARV